MEVCDLMPDEQTLQLSIKYATRQRHLQLAQRISQLAQQRAQQDQGEDEEEGEDDYLQARWVSHLQDILGQSSKQCMLAGWLLNIPTTSLA